MPLRTQNLEWLNHNAQRAYPLSADGSRLSETEDFKIPDDFMVEMDLVVSRALNVDPTGFFVRKISAHAGGYGVVVGYQPSVGDAVDVASALVPSATHTRNKSYRLNGVGAYHDGVSGRVAVGDLSSVSRQPGGFFTFDVEATRLETNVVRPMIRGVSSIVVVNGAERSRRIYNDIELTAGDNFQIIYSQSGDGPGQIRLNAVDGTGFNAQCECVDVDAATPITSINDVRPTAGGAFYLQGTDCLQIEPIQNGLKLNDTCSTPCCSCDDLEKVTAELVRFGDDKRTLDNFMVRLEQSVAAMDSVVLGSKLNDNGCSDCG